MTAANYAIEDILPHTSPMALLDTVIAADEASITTSVTIQPDSPFCQAEGMPSHVAIEYMAQSCAAFVGIQAITAGEAPRIGYLLGTRNFTTDKVYFQIGETLSVAATVVYKDAEMGVFDCSVGSEGQTVAAARLTVFQPDKDNEFGAAVE